MSYSAFFHPMFVAKHDPLFQRTANYFDDFYLKENKRLPLQVLTPEPSIGEASLILESDAILKLEKPGTYHVTSTATQCVILALTKDIVLTVEGCNLVLLGEELTLVNTQAPEALIIMDRIFLNSCTFNGGLIVVDELSAAETLLRHDDLTIIATTYRDYSYPGCYRVIDDPRMRILNEDRVTLYLLEEWYRLIRQLAGAKLTLPKKWLKYDHYELMGRFGSISLHQLYQAGANEPVWESYQEVDKWRKDHTKNVSEPVTTISLEAIMPVLIDTTLLPIVAEAEWYAQNTPMQVICLLPALEAHAESMNIKPSLLPEPLGHIYEALTTREWTSELLDAADDLLILFAHPEKAADPNFKAQITHPLAIHVAQVTNIAYSVIGGGESADLPDPMSPTPDTVMLHTGVDLLDPIKYMEEKASQVDPQGTAGTDLGRETWSASEISSKTPPPVATDACLEADGVADPSTLGEDFTFDPEEGGSDDALAAAGLDAGLMGDPLNITDPIEDTGHPGKDKKRKRHGQ